MTMMRDSGTTQAPTDAAIKAMFDHRARRADAVDLRGPILTATSSQRQRGRWRVLLPVLVPPRLTRVLVLALIAAAFVALGVVGSGALRGDLPPVLTPTATAAGFERPFEYAIPPDSTIRSSVGARRREVFAWVDGPILPFGAESIEPYGGQNPAGNARGIIIASAEQAWSHGNSGRFMLRTAPSEFITDLRDTASVPMGSIDETTLDGRPALTTMLPGTGGTDIHVRGPITGLSLDNYVLVNLPSRLIVADIDGTTVFLLIWARTDADLLAWMPVADEFVDSIHFVPVGQL